MKSFSDNSVIEAYQNLSREKKDEFIEGYLEMSQTTYPLTRDEHMKILNSVGRNDETETNNVLIIDLTSPVTNQARKLKETTAQTSSLKNYVNNQEIAALNFSPTSKQTEIINVESAKAGLDEIRDSDAMDLQCAMSNSSKENLNPNSNCSLNSIVSELGTRIQVSDSPVQPKTSSSYQTPNRLQFDKKLEQQKRNTTRKHKPSQRDVTVDCPNKKFKSNTEDKHTSDGEQDTKQSEEKTDTVGHQETVNKQNTEYKQCTEKANQDTERKQYPDGKEHTKGMDGPERKKVVSRLARRRVTTIYHPQKGGRNGLILIPKGTVSVDNNSK